MKIEHKENWIAGLLSILGSCFLIYYIFRASTDVICSDYVRIVYYYLEDVFDLSYLMSWEGISRIPITFLSRIINKELFGYSVLFDKVVGIFGLFLFNFVTVKYVFNALKSNFVRIVTSIIITIVSFSLMSWEMILNGTGYPHFLTTGLIAVIFYLYDRMVKRTKAIITLENLDSSDLKYYGNDKENNRLTNMISLIDTSQLQRKNLSAMFFIYLLTALVSVCIAGSYCVSFLCVLIFFSVIEIFVFITIRNKYNKGEIDEFNLNDILYEEFREQYNSEEIRGFGKYKGEKYSTVNNESTFKIFFKFLLLIIIAIICLACYFKSNSTGEPLIPVGTYDVTLAEAVLEDAKFPFRFLLKSLASSVIGVETFIYAINFNTINENMIFLVGFIYLFILFVAFIVFIIKFIFDGNEVKNIFDINSYRDLYPLMFIVIGVVNYFLIFLARYQFLKDDYGMSSRYAIQYMFLTIGIILIFAMWVDDIVFNKKYIKKIIKYDKEGNKKIIAGDGKNLSIMYVLSIIVCILCVGVLTFGHITTTIDEIFKADYRKMAYETLERVAKIWTEYSDDALENAFEYKRDVNHIKYALTTLEKQKLNVFRESNEVLQQ